MWLLLHISGILSGYSLFSDDNVLLIKPVRTPVFGSYPTHSLEESMRCGSFAIGLFICSIIGSGSSCAPCRAIRASGSVAFLHNLLRAPSLEVTSGTFENTCPYGNTSETLFWQNSHMMKMCTQYGNVHGQLLFAPPRILVSSLLSLCLKITGMLSWKMTWIFRQL